MSKAFVIMYDDWACAGDPGKTDKAFSVEATKEAAEELVKILNEGRRLKESPARIVLLGPEVHEKFQDAYEFYYEEVPLHLLSKLLENE